MTGNVKDTPTAVMVLHRHSLDIGLSMLFISLVIVIEYYSWSYLPTSPIYAMIYSLAAVGSVGVLLLASGKRLKAIERLSLQRFYSLCFPIVLVTLSHFPFELNYNPLKALFNLFPPFLFERLPGVVHTINHWFSYPWLTNMVSVTRYVLTLMSQYLPFYLGGALFVFVCYHLLTAGFRLLHRTAVSATTLQWLFKYGFLLLFSINFASYTDKMVIQSDWLALLLSIAKEWFMIIFPLARGI
ncbi:MULTISPECIES: hypothetical protein [unclassified Vibrio]|uniref:Uncharacterized protein n=1 Tax=Vibrio sp. HB236076 TaxID=3232307 RepID=A0AB39HH11_9VIBR|nr:hypothetical protein [Vibrio sp. HB161653]MDP5255512.1 hypothetical protein [Vibrio sp. HB161653]